MSLDWIPIRDAAQRMGYNSDYIRELVRIGRIRGRKVVTVWLVDPESLSEYLIEQAKLGDKRGAKPKGVRHG